MTSCIFTVIKNEHEYLDEWIKYHLNLGINHIFIFEDIDSISHKNIVNKYIDRVSLNSISEILNDNDLLKASELKRTKKKSIHHIYVKKGLEYIKSQSYDWCFVIDCDEFITLENSGLDKTLSLYKDYEAIVLQWKLYGASGLISKPNYRNSGVVDIYTKEFTGYIPEKRYALCKTCYNMKAYRESHFWNSHQPSDICNWCRTDFSKERDIPVYANIFIRHYITKSWEEYVWKLNERGFMWGLRRNYDFFFTINPELMSLKESLLQSLNKEALVVLPYVQGRSQGNELCLALNGWRKFCRFKYHFVVIGEFDERLIEKYPWVEFIYKPRIGTKPNQYTPHLDIMSKFNYIINKYSNDYNGFIYMVDDNYAIKPFVLKDIMTIYHHSMSFTGQESAPTSYWNHNKWKTRQLLDREGLPHVNYTSHFPYYMDFTKLKEIMDKFNLLEESYVFDDIYFNYFTHPESIIDSSIRLGIWSKDIYKRDFQNALHNPNIKFICNSVEGWSKELEEDLKRVVN